MELALNLLWFAIAVSGLVLVPKRRSPIVWFALIAIAVLLFPIISVSDDMNADRAFNDSVAAIVAMVVLFVAFIAIARLRAVRPTALTVLIATPSDPRSPPAR
jgi:uncharacterized membrane protein